MKNKPERDISEWLEREPAKSSWDAEYPEMDREYVDTYPIDFGTIHPEDIVRRPDHAIYVHVPLLRDGSSSDDPDHTRIDEGMIGRYLSALESEMGFYAENTDIPDRNISSVYFGEGVSHALEMDQFIDLFDHLVSCFDIDVESTEMTYECHPPFFDPVEMEAIRSRGVNRVNIHVRTFSDELLSRIGKTFQSRETNVRAIEGAHGVGFEKVSIDLLYRLPGQDMDSWERDLETALELDVDGFSLYSFHNSTPLREEGAEESGKPTEVEMYYRAIDKLIDERYNHFTEPDLAKPGKENQYLLDSWQAPQKHLIGFGAGAYSKQVNDTTYVNTYHVGEYVDLLDNDKLPVLIGQELNAKERMAKYMVFGTGALRIRKEPFGAEFGFEIAEIFGDKIDRLKGHGLLEETDDAYEVTREGKIYIDNICKSFYTEECEGMAQPLGPHLQEYTRDEFADFEDVAR